MRIAIILFLFVVAGKVAFAADSCMVIKDTAGKSIEAKKITIDDGLFKIESLDGSSVSLRAPTIQSIESKATLPVDALPEFLTDLEKRVEAAKQTANSASIEKKEVWDSIKKAQQSLVDSKQDVRSGLVIKTWLSKEPLEATTITLQDGALKMASLDARIVPLPASTFNIGYKAILPPEKKTALEELVKVAEKTAQNAKAEKERLDAAAKAAADKEAADRAAKEVADARAAKEATERAAKEAADRAAKEVTERAAKEVADARAAKEAADTRVAKEIADARDAKEAAERAAEKAADAAKEAADRAEKEATPAEKHAKRKAEAEAGKSRLLSGKANIWEFRSLLMDLAPKEVINIIGRPDNTVDDLWLYDRKLIWDDITQKQRSFSVDFSSANITRVELRF